MSVAPFAGNAQSLVATARSHYRAQEMAAAKKAMGAAANLLPDDPSIAFMLAQFAYEGWYESVPLFERAARLDPANPDLVRNFALALSSEGQGERAQNLLEAILNRNPLWIDGQNTLATLRVTAGDADPFRGFRAASGQNPENVVLRLAWFHKLAAASEWEMARQVVEDGTRRDVNAMRLALLYLDCETGEAADDPEIFAPFAGSQDAGIALMRIRHALRTANPDLALSIASGQLDLPNANQFWPYCSLCWRLLDDPRAQWLDGEPGFAAAVDLNLSLPQLDRLTTFLRDLHTMSAPYPEQSVRGGTQTERNLFLHHDPLIRNLRHVVTEAVERWRDGLPQGDAGHPLLSHKPDIIRFSGSWSVRLAGGGHHSAHTHPQGWASSAIYFVVPPATGHEHEGELALGMPPPELGLGLTPTRYVAPKRGRLALFPSTTWHGTVPFAGDERLTIAFDVAPAGAETGSAR